MTGISSQSVTPDENYDELQGLDLGPAIEWYGEYIDEITPGIKRATMLGGNMTTIINDHALQCKKELATMSIAKFPRSAQRRAIPGTITVKPSLWFHRDSTKEKPIATANQEEAICPTAIIPSYVCYSRQEDGALRSQIELYQISDEIDPWVIQIIQIQGLVHEYGHTVADAFLYGKEDLKFPDEREFNKDAFIAEFVRLTEQVSPMSEYSGHYRKEDNKYPQIRPDDKESKNAFSIALREELAESIAAYMLNFVYTRDEGRGLDPFKDRSEVRNLIEGFLKAEKIGTK